MAYQNIGTPVFYVCNLQWLKHNGMLISQDTDFTADHIDLIGINPTSIIDLYAKEGTEGVGTNDNMYYISQNAGMFKDFMYREKNFVMALGHNFSNLSATLSFGKGDQAYQLICDTPYVNGENERNGFSIWRGDDADAINTNKVRFQFDYIEQELPIKIGSLLYGNYYEMPHSPDLNLTLTREYAGVKVLETKGGATLTNTNYESPSKWGNAGCWELYQGDTPVQNLSRSGRRVWDLSFSYISDSDLFPDMSALNNFGDSTYTEGGDHENTLLNDYNFFSVVLNKTQGLPFIFQPDSSNNNSDQFAIARFDQNSFQFRQVAHNTYNIKLKIRESW